MHFLIDVDSVIYKAGCANEVRRWYVGSNGQAVANFQYKAEAIEFAGEDVDEYEFWMEKTAGPLSHSLANTKHIMEKIVNHPRCITYGVYISGKDNFRYDIDPNYKGQRDKSSRPIHEQEIREYLLSAWDAVESHGCEVDDIVSYECLANPLTNVIVSIDKDLDNTAGWHYNYDAAKAYYVTTEEADLNFYRQLLSGDPTDNIKGVKGIGAIKAKDILQNALTPERMCSIVWKVYEDKGYDWQYFLDQGRLLWMWRQPDDLWMPPIHEPVEEQGHE